MGTTTLTEMGKIGYWYVPYIPLFITELDNTS